MSAAGPLGMKVAIVADDLTGALDAAAPFAARGARTRVACTPDAILEACAGSCDVLAVTTASRHLPAAEARAAVSTAWRTVAAHEPGIVFKKIDSTLRGHPVAEALALAAAGGRRRIVFAPAAPSQGRTVRDGVVHVDGVPLSRTAFARDPLSPPAPDPICVQVGTAPDPLPCHLLPPPDGAEAPVPPGFSVMDAATDEDLRRIADWATRAADTVLVGAVGLADAVAASRLGPRRDPPALRTDRPMLFLVGSRAERSRAQCDRLSALPGVATEASSLSPNAPAALLTPSGAAADPMEVAAGLGRAAATLVAEGRVDTMLVTGGDTLAALLVALEVPVLDVIGEIYPGIPLSRVDAGGRSLRIVSKAGGFGAETLFADILARIEASA